MKMVLVYLSIMALASLGCKGVGSSLSEDQTLPQQSTSNVNFLLDAVVAKVTATEEGRTAHEQLTSMGYSPVALSQVSGTTEVSGDAFYIHYKDASGTTSGTKKYKESLPGDNEGILGNSSGRGQEVQSRIGNGWGVNRQNGYIGTYTPPSSRNPAFEQRNADDLEINGGIAEEDKKPKFDKYAEGQNGSAGTGTLIDERLGNDDYHRRMEAKKKSGTTSQQIGVRLLVRFSEEVSTLESVETADIVQMSLDQLGTKVVEQQQPTY